MNESSNLDTRILQILSQEPCLSQVEVAARVGKSKPTCKAAIDRLVAAGLIRPKGYYPALDSEGRSNGPTTGFIFLSSPSEIESIKELEQVLDSHMRLGCWHLLAGTTYDYVFVLNVHNMHPSLEVLYRKIRALGVSTDTHFMIGKGDQTR